MQGGYAMKTVGEILRGKGHNVWSVSPDIPAHDALELMANKNIGAVLVVDNDQVIGIMSERDYVRKVIVKDKESSNILVRDIMTEKVAYVSPKQTTEECMILMTNKHIRHLPVMEEERLVGIISIGDVVKAVIVEQEFIIDQLERYIKGGYAGG
jgi:CBS domain-containing protein